MYKYIKLILKNKFFKLRCVTVIMQHCSYSNLDNLIKNTGSLPEIVLKQITCRILKALEIYKIKCGEAFECLSPNNILFDYKYNLKVSTLLKFFKYLFFLFKFSLVLDLRIYFTSKTKE